jgi:hypothetical protein
MGACVLNTEHFNAACEPSCGHAGNLCVENEQCCDASAICSDGLVGPTKDCGKCCKNTCN